MMTTGRVLDEIVADCIRKRAQAKKLEDEAAMLKEEANTILMLYRNDGSIADKMVGLDGVGKITFVTRTTKSVNQELFKTGLMNAGVGIGIIKSAEDSAVTVKESTTPQFTAEKV
jgi:hypothetical protein